MIRLSAWLRGGVACSLIVASQAAADVMYIATEAGTLLRYDVNAVGTPSLLSSTTKPGLVRPYGLATRLNGDLIVGDRGPCTACAGGGMMSIDAPECSSIGDVLGIEAWKDAVFPIVLSMEQVNAAALDAKRRLTEDDKASVENSLRELEALIARFETAH